MDAAARQHRIQYQSIDPAKDLIGPDDRWLARMELARRMRGDPPADQLPVFPKYAYPDRPPPSPVDASAGDGVKNGTVPAYDPD